MKRNEKKADEKKCTQFKKLEEIKEYSVYTVYWKRMYYLRNREKDCAF